MLKNFRLTNILYYIIIYSKHNKPGHKTINIKINIFLLIIIILDLKIEIIFNVLYVIIKRRISYIILYNFQPLLV